MPSPREFLVGHWRAVSVLGVTEILSWGALYGGFSLGLLVGGLASRHVGALIERFGGHAVMSIARGAVGLLAAAFALLLLLPFSAMLAAAFAVMYGMANGLMTIARGTVPLCCSAPKALGGWSGASADPSWPCRRRRRCACPTQPKALRTRPPSCWPPR